MLSPAPFSIMKKPQDLDEPKPELNSKPHGVDSTSTKTFRGQDQLAEMPNTPPSPSAFRKPNSGHRRKSVTFSAMLDVFPSPKHNYSAQQEDPAGASTGSLGQPPPRPAREISDLMPHMQRQLSAIETGFSGMTASGVRSASGRSNESASTVLHNGSMSPPSILPPKVRGGVNNSEGSTVDSAFNPNAALFRQMSDASRTTSASSHYHSRQSSASSSHVASSGSKPVSKVKALAQAFNSLTASKDSINRRASLSGHRKSGSWTEKIRRSMSGTRKKEEEERKEPEVIGEVFEPESPLKKDPEVIGAVEVMQTHLHKAKLKKLYEEDDKQPLLAASPPGSPSMVPTEPQSLEQAMDALGIANDGRVSFQYSMDPSSSIHSRFATGGMMPGLEDDVRLVSSPAGSPSMQATEAPFVFPVRPALTSRGGENDSVSDDDTGEHVGEKMASFLATRSNHRSSSIYSRSENGRSPQQTVQSMDEGLHSRMSSSKVPGLENAACPILTNPASSLHVKKGTGSPIKTRTHMRSHANTPPASRASSTINHLTSLAATPSTTQSQRTHTPSGIPFSACLAQDYTEYLDQNIPQDTTPPPIPARNPARLERTKRLHPVSRPLTFQREDSQASTGIGAYDSPYPPHPHQFQPSSYIGANRLSTHAPSTSCVPQQSIFDTQTRAHTEGAKSAALPRLKREARDFSRLGEGAAEGLVGEEQFAGEGRGNDSEWM